MIRFIAGSKQRQSPGYRLLVVFINVAFIAGLIFPPAVLAQGAGAGLVSFLPQPGVMLPVSPAYVPTMIKGLTIDPQNPFKFDFIVDTGDSKLAGQDLVSESKRLIKYFLITITTPEEDLWVNLSPYEKDRIVPQALGQTEMGRDMLAQDYILKQLTASLMYPEDELGKKFWDRVYKQAQEKFGTTQIPVNTFNKVWVVPDQAGVIEYNGSAFVKAAHLKVMLEEDYLALQNNLENKQWGLDKMTGREKGDVSNVSSQVVREILIPEIEKEVNQGQSFAPLRQIYNSMILATWYKIRLKESLLVQVYADKNKIQGVDVADKQIKEKIYQQYLAAFKKGVYSYIKEDLDPATQQPVARKYFSGGETMGNVRQLLEGNLAGFDGPKGPAIEVVHGNVGSLSPPVRAAVLTVVRPNSPGAGQFRVTAQLSEVGPQADMVVLRKQIDQIEDAVGQAKPADAAMLVSVPDEDLRGRLELTAMASRIMDVAAVKTFDQDPARPADIKTMRLLLEQGVLPGQAVIEEIIKHDKDNRNYWEVSLANPEYIDLLTALVTSGVLKDSKPWEGIAVRIAGVVQNGFDLPQASHAKIHRLYDALDERGIYSGPLRYLRVGYLGMGLGLMAMGYESKFKEGEPFPAQWQGFIQESLSRVNKRFGMTSWNESETGWEEMLNVFNVGVEHGGLYKQDEVETVLRLVLDLSFHNGQGIIFETEVARLLRSLIDKKLLTADMVSRQWGKSEHRGYKKPAMRRQSVDLEYDMRVSGKRGYYYARDKDAREISAAIQLFELEIFKSLAQAGLLQDAAILREILPDLIKSDQPSAKALPLRIEVLTALVEQGALSQESGFTPELSRIIGGIKDGQFSVLQAKFLVALVKRGFFKQGEVRDALAAALKSPREYFLQNPYTNARVLQILNEAEITTDLSFTDQLQPQVMERLGLGSPVLEEVQALAGLIVIGQISQQEALDAVLPIIFREVLGRGVSDGSWSVALADLLEAMQDKGFKIDILSTAGVDSVYQQLDAIKDLDLRFSVAKEYFLRVYKGDLPQVLREEGRMKAFLRMLKPSELTRANIDDLFKRFAAKDPVLMRQWARILVSAAKDNLVLRKIDFSDGGDAIANYQELMRGAFADLPGRLFKKPAGLPEGSIGTPKPVTTKAGVLEIDGVAIDLTKPADAQFGRTLVYNSPDRKRAIHLKFMKNGEDKETLAYEHDMMNFLNDHAAEWDLTGKYPRGKVRLGRVKVKRIPHLENIESEGKNIRLAQTSEDDGSYYSFMAYETDLAEDGGNPYMTYLNDPDLSEEDFLQALRVNVHDYMAMARQGLIATEIIELFHNQEYGTSRRYDWMVDVRHHQQHRRGAGRLNNITGSTMYPNLRLSGPADFAEINFIGDLIKDTEARDLADNRLGRLLNMVDRQEDRAINFIASAYLGDTFLATLLMIPTYLQRKGALSYEKETSEKGTFLQKALEVVLTESYEAFDDTLLRGNWENLGVDFQLMARQMAYYMTPKYFEDYTAKKDPPAEFFEGAQVIPINPGRGWTKDHGWDITSRTYKTPSRNPAFQRELRSYDLGPVNGPNPLQEMIKALYISTTGMVGDIWNDDDEPGTVLSAEVLAQRKVDAAKMTDDFVAVMTLVKVAKDQQSAQRPVAEIVATFEEAQARVSGIASNRRDKALTQLVLLAISMDEIQRALDLGKGVQSQLNREKIAQILLNKEAGPAVKEFLREGFSPHLKARILLDVLRLEKRLNVDSFTTFEEAVKLVVTLGKGERDQLLVDLTLAQYGEAKGEDFIVKDARDRAMLGTVQAFAAKFLTDLGPQLKLIDQAGVVQREFQGRFVPDDVAMSFSEDYLDVGKIKIETRPAAVGQKAEVIVYFHAGLTIVGDLVAALDQVYAAVGQVSAADQNRKTARKTDPAILGQAASPAVKTPVGGINLNSALLDLQIKRDGKGIPLPRPQQPLNTMKIEGFIPIIINVTPVNLPLLMGFNPEPADRQSGPLALAGEGTELLATFKNE